MRPASARASTKADRATIPRHETICSAICSSSVSPVKSLRSPGISPPRWQNPGASIARNLPILMKLEVELGALHSDTDIAQTARSRPGRWHDRFSRRWPALAFPQGARAMRCTPRFVIGRASRPARQRADTVAILHRLDATPEEERGAGAVRTRILHRVFAGAFRWRRPARRIAVVAMGIAGLWSVSLSMTTRPSCFVRHERSNVGQLVSNRPLLLFCSARFCWRENPARQGARRPVSSGVYI